MPVKTKSATESRFKKGILKKKNLEIEVDQNFNSRNTNHSKSQNSMDQIMQAKKELQ